MEQQALPTHITLHTGAKLPLIGFGTAGVKDIKTTLKEAIVDAGYRHIDTAKLYRNEAAIGEALQEIFNGPYGIKREDLFITTKLWVTEKANPEEALKRQLKDLQLDYVDLYLIHASITPQISKEGETLEFEKIPLHKTWKELEGLAKSGLTKHIGVSNFNVQLILDLLTYAEIKPAVNQLEVHPYHAQVDLVEFNKKLGIPVVAYSPFASPGGQITLLTKNIFDEKVVKDLAIKYNKTPSQILLNWSIQRGQAPIPKASSLAHLRDNIDSLNFQLSKEDVAVLSTLDSRDSFTDFKEHAMVYHIPLFA